MSRRRGATAADRGTVTAEIAVALPALVLVVGVGIGVIQAAAVQVGCVDAARLGARALARGDPGHVAEGIAAANAPGEARVRVDADDGFARVTVTVTVRVAGLPGPGWAVAGRATTPIEAPR